MTTVWTIGHSTRSAEEFIQILKSHQIEAVVDVRSFPGSRRYPHFNKPELARLLQDNGVEYVHIPELGGRRKPNRHSKNTAWRNVSFRAYADHMETEEFQKGIASLFALGDQKRCAIMCSEAVWWRCHRSLVSDYLKANGVEVIHIIDEKTTQPHPFTSAARIVDGKLTYEGLLAGSE